MRKRIWLSLTILIWLTVPLSVHATTGDAGKHQIEVISEVVITDQTRNRKIPLKIYLPAEGGPYPVILYSHGLGGSKDGKRYLGKFWASHGYVGIFMTHFGSDRSVMSRDKSREENMAALRQATRNPKTLIDRPRDVTSVLNQISEIERMAPELKGKLDANRIGLSGHSFGANTTLISAGGWADFTKRRFQKDFSDPRPIAFLAMSPQGGRPNQNPKSLFGKITRPMMTMTGSNDTSPIRPGETGKSRLKPYLNMPAGDKYSLWMEGAYHWTFGDGRANRTPDPKLHLYIKISSLAFWDAYLKGSESAKQFLKSRAIDKMSEGQARLDFR